MLDKIVILTLHNISVFKKNTSWHLKLMQVYGTVSLTYFNGIYSQLKYAMDCSVIG